MTEEKPNVKTTLTKDDQAGWYIFDNRFGATSCFYWNGDECAGCVGDGFPFYPPSDFFDEGDTNFRRLVEAPEPAGLDGISSKTFRIEHNPNCVKPFLVRFPGKGKGMIHGDQRDAIGCGATIIEAINAAEDPYRKITPEPVTNEAAREEFRKWLVEGGARDESGAASLIADKAAEVFGRVGQQTIARQSDEIEELKAERDQLHRTREALEGEIERLKSERMKVAMAYDPNCEEWHVEDQTNAMLAARQVVESVQEAAEYLGRDPEGCLTDICDELMGQVECLKEAMEAAPPQPEVIEGRGQAVTKEQEGWWIRESKEGLAPKIYAPELCEGDRFATGYRYMRCPTFPPRPAFVAPEKPELVLIRYQGQACWAVRDGDWYRRIGFTGGMSAGLCELLDPATGKPLTAGAAQ